MMGNAEIKESGPSWLVSHHLFGSLVEKALFKDSQKMAYTYTSNGDVTVHLYPAVD